MPKSKPSKPKLDSHQVEVAIREAVANIPGINDLPELDYCRMVAEGVESYQSGIEMRLQELEADEG